MLCIVQRDTAERLQSRAVAVSADATGFAEHHPILQALLQSCYVSQQPPVLLVDHCLLQQYLSRNRCYCPDSSPKVCMRYMIACRMYRT